MKRIGVDLGGTNIRVALVNEQGVERKISSLCPSDADDPEVVLRKIADMIKELMTPEVGSIGVGVPSIVDVERGIVYNTANIPCWKEVHLKDYLSGCFPGVRISVNNDANCFAAGEAAYGSAKGFDNVVGIIIGTGTGAGVVIEGRLYNGVNVCAGEIGYFPYRDSYYEHYTSGEFFASRGIDAREAAALARNGDKEMQRLWEEFGGHVGSLVKTTLLAYDPQAIVLGGGMTGASDLFEKAMRESLDDFYYPKVSSGVKVIFSTTQDVAILGAAAI